MQFYYRFVHILEVFLAKLAYPQIRPHDRYARKTEQTLIDLALHYNEVENEMNIRKEIKWQSSNNDTYAVENDGNVAVERPRTRRRERRRPRERPRRRRRLR